MLTKFFILAAASCAVSAAQAQTAGDLPAGRIGDATNAWLTLQSSGVAAAPAQPMLGAEASAAYARYMASFASSVPERFESSLNGSRSGVSGKSATDLGGQN